MKNILKMLAFVFLLTMLGSCKKYLTTLPDNRIDVDNITFAQIKQLLTDAYPHRTYLPFTEAMSDNAEDKANAVTTTGDKNGYNINFLAFTYTDNVQDVNDDSPIGYFYECYRAIASANQALALIKPAEESKYGPQIGEALLCRAYAHFMLVTLFAKAYDPAIAASEPGIPYITTVETDPFVQYDRKTVQYVYDMIEKDLNKGLPLLRDDAYGNAPKFHFNQQAAYAFASRFYLFKRDYPKVIEMSNNVFGTTAPAAVIRNVRNYPTTFGGIQSQYNANTENTNLLLQETYSSYGSGFYGYKFGMGETVRASIFTIANVTGGTLAWDSRVYGASSNFYNFPKFYSISSKPSSGHNTNEIVTMPLFSADEVLINRIEAKARLNNFTGALADVSIWTNNNTTANVTMTLKKIVDYYDTTTTKPVKDTLQHLVSAALFFKRVSYMSEGLRWFDIIRLDLPVTHRSANTGTIVLAPGDKRRLLQLPQEAVNSGLPLNPR